MFRLLQLSAAIVIALVVVNESEARSTGANKTSGRVASSAKSFKEPVHGPGSSHDPRGPKDPVHGPGSSHDPRGPKTPLHGPGSSHNPRGPKTPVHGPGSSHNPIGTHPVSYRNWGHRQWNSRYGCEFCWSGVDNCYFYFYAPANSYYPVSCIEQFPPVRK